MPCALRCNLQLALYVDKIDRTRHAAGPTRRESLEADRSDDEATENTFELTIQRSTDIHDLPAYLPHNHVICLIISDLARHDIDPDKIRSSD